MIIDTDLDTGAVTLVEPRTFTAFHVAVRGGGTDDERLPAALAPHGHLDGEHAWIRTDAVTALARPEADEAWHEGFAAMVAFAREKGFLSDDGTAIRAHLEAAP